jgi:DNA-binding NarL/FixJ family response regulator
MPRRTGLQAARELSRHRPDLRILMLSMQAELPTISPRTVERHREHLMGKLGMRDRVQLTRYAIRRGLVEP